MSTTPSESSAVRRDPAHRAATASRHIVVVGSGRLAQALCQSLAATPVPEPVLVTVLARDHAAGANIARAGQVRSAVSGTAVSFAAEQLTDERSTLARLRPSVLVCVASEQSPYERAQAPSAWTDLVARVGFGLTLALQTEPLVRLAGALADATPDTLLVNGCFPDAVNPVLAALGLPVHCGLGNVATVAACLQSALGLPDSRGLQVLGHHAHLSPPDRDGTTVDGAAGEVKVWRDGRAVAGVTTMLATYRALPRVELNAIGGHAGARLVAELATGAADVTTSLPGPLGLPGGYPVHLRGRRITLNLPDEVSQAQAVAWNTAAGHRDGIEVSDGQVRYTARARAALEAYLPDLAAGWPASALPDVVTRFIALRQQLRTAQPAPAGTPFESEDSRCL